MMDFNLYGQKELYDVAIKATYPIEVNGKSFVPGEMICFLDEVIMFNVDEVKSTASANGGQKNAPKVIWDDTKEMNLSFFNGVFSKQQFSILNNAKLIDQVAQEITVPKKEELESSETGEIILAKEPIEGTLYIHRVSDGEKLNYTLNENIATISDTLEDVFVYYDFLYNGNSKKLAIGQKIFNSFVKLEGKTRLRSDTTGEEITGIIRIPKLRIMSSLSMTLGEGAQPLGVNFTGKASLDGPRGNQTAMNITFLDEDIDADI